MPDRDRAQDLNTRAMEHEERGEVDEAEALYKLASQADPEFSYPVFNLGLLCKRQRRWSESLAYNQRAVELDPDDKAGWWNLGIAATALGDWTEARRAWRGAGVEIPDGDGPLQMQMGTIPVRLNPDGDAEVVWGARIDPARVILLSVPVPGSGHNFRDLMLHDGAPSGYRIVGDYEVPVFDTLERLERSCWSTFGVEAVIPSEDALEALFECVGEAGDGVEDWGTVRVLCKQCSEGTPHEHESPVDEEWPCTRSIGLAARDEATLRAHLDAWQQDFPEVAVNEVERMSGVVSE